MQLGKKKRAANDEVFGYSVNLMSQFFREVGALNSLTDSEHALKLEMVGWVLPFSFSQARDWRQLVAVFGSRCLNILLERFSKMLLIDVEECKAAMPSWEAAFENDVLNVPLACRMLRGKLDKVVKTHNQIHQTLTHMAHAGATLSVVPALRDHEATSEAIAVATTTMAKATVAAVVIIGCAVMEKSDDPCGSEAAKRFLDKHSQTDEKLASIPASFWRELEGMSQVAGPVQRAAGARQLNALQDVKAELPDGRDQSGSPQVPAGTPQATSGRHVPKAQAASQHGGALKRRKRN